MKTPLSGRASGPRRWRRGGRRRGCPWSRRRCRLQCSVCLVSVCPTLIATTETSAKQTVAWTAIISSKVRTEIVHGQRPRREILPVTAHMLDLST